MSSQNVLNCTFIVYFGDYGCQLSGIEVLEREANVTFIGEHLTNRTNADVEVVWISGSNTPHIIQQIFTTFPNINELEVLNSNLQQIDIPPTAQLQSIDFAGNQIPRITNGTFVNQTRLTFLGLRNNSIEFLDVNAFEGLSQLNHLQLINNRITEVLPGTLSPLISARIIDFEGNLLSEVTEEMYSSNSNVTTLYLERNRISSVHPNFARNLPNLWSINFSENVCINRFFWLDEEEGLMIMNNALNVCFNGGVAPELKRISLEYVGSLTIYDNFGNLIGRF